ncbi:MAG: ferrous iron transport protein B [Deltaproteobacteria bacterium]|nr:ferrous iron transport protein B [Deltaproteobacteria bacterium]
MDAALSVATQNAADVAPPLVVLVGNPNTGKTTLFNRLTGQNARVGNYPGVTVERRRGLIELTHHTGDASTIEIVDVPGTYSLAARSAEEQIALNAALGFCGNPRPDLAVVVVDAGQLLRNLYLVLQLAELEVPILIVLNMIDEVAHNAPAPDAIARLFRAPVVCTNARKGDGIAELRAALAAALLDPPRPAADVRYPPAVVRDADEVAQALPAGWRLDARRDRALALWALTSIEPHDELREIDPQLRQACLAVVARDHRDLDGEVIGARYAFLDANAPLLHTSPDPHPRKHALSERIDRILLHPLLGLPLFLLLMLVVFQALFSWADPAIRLVEHATAWLQTQLVDLLPAGVITDLLIEGAIGGVGNVLVFLPQIVLLFLFIGLLEDSGYMARVAFLVDRLMRSLGLHGRAFVPMLSGFACAVPAILATRTMERQRDRLLTLMVIPLMTCSARLPVYTLIIAALFPPTHAFGLPVQGLLMVAMYVFSIIVTLTAAALLGRTLIRGVRVPLILELPPYRMPTASSIGRMVVDRASTFVREAGTVILACTIVLWALLYFPRMPQAPDLAPGSAAHRTAALEHSFGGRLGHALEPALRPLGFDWKIGVGIIGAFVAREVFVSTMGIIYGVGDDEKDVQPLRDRIRRERRADGTPVYTPLVGLSLMVFFALACQCMSTLAVTHRETRSWRWPAFMFAYMTSLAWVVSFAVYQGGRLLGF